MQHDSLVLRNQVILSCCDSLAEQLISHDKHRNIHRVSIRYIILQSKLPCQIYLRLSVIALYDAISGPVDSLRPTKRKIRKGLFYYDKPGRMEARNIDISTVFL